MLIETLIITLLILLIIKRNMEWLHNLHFNWIAVVFAAFFIEVILNLICNFADRSVIQLIVDYTIYFHMTIYSLLFLFIIRNIKINGIGIIGIGFLLNAIVIFANKGFMPVDITMGITYGFDHTLYDLQNQYIFGHNILTDTTQWSILADVINVPPPYFWPKTISAGDVFIDLGLIILLLSTCFSKKRTFKQKNVF